MMKQEHGHRPQTPSEIDEPGLTLPQATAIFVAAHVLLLVALVAMGAIQG